MIFVYAISAPGSELDGETFEIQDQTRDRANDRAAGRVRETFAWARRTDARAVHVATWPSREALRKAEAAESGVSLRSSCKRHDFRDGDICSRCDALKAVGS